MRKIFYLLGRLAFPIIVIPFTSPLFALQTAAGGSPTAEGKLAIVANRVVTVNPSCHNDSGVAWIKIRNTDSAASRPISLDPTATGVTRKSPPGAPNATVKATVVAGPESDQPLLNQTLEPGKEVWIRVEVTGLDEPGDWETTLQNENLDVGPIGTTR